MATRQVHHADALVWLQSAALAGCSIITSLPDVSEVTMPFETWRAWFVDAARAVLDATPPEGIALFYQSDIRHDGRWIDKGHLVQRAADDADVALLFHKIVHRRPAGTLTRGRASYSHLLAFSRTVRPPLADVTPDILLAAGEMPTPKSMGVLACTEAVQFVQRSCSSRTIVDPFCGAGTVLAVANALGLDSIGVDLSTRACRKAKKLEISL